MGGISYPLLSDFWPHGAAAEQYGVLRAEGHSERAIFIIDKDGRIQYIDVHDIDDQPDNDLLFAELARIDPQNVRLELSPEEGMKNLPQSGVVMYCTPWCTDCKLARHWLKKNNVPYTEVDIFTTPGAERQVRTWTGGALITPVINFKGKIVIDFDLPKLKALI
ncbi:MAG: redoxin domain-containing protein [Anaerolineaceae bacterium]|nr:redoxin domain-containing protein [Anaerolineaceae bacterium]